MAIGHVDLIKLVQVREKQIRYEKAVSNIETAINAVKGIYENSYREIAVVVGLDNKNRPSMVHIIGVGNPNQSMVILSSLFKAVLLSNSTSFLLFHNHPSGSLFPSHADKEITKKIKEVSGMLELSFLDHIILNSDASEHFSFYQHALMG